MIPEPEANPYAPPAADLAASAAEQPLRTKRPPSVKWATVAFCFGLLGAWASYEKHQALFKEFGIDQTTALTPHLWIQLIANAVPLIVLLVAGRRPIAYGVSVVALAWICGSRLLALVSLLAVENPLGLDALEFVIVFLILIDLLLSWLFIRFTFGRPSHQYFRVFIHES
jgi:hypothetical protein